MAETEKLIDEIVNGIKEKKGRKITIVDMSKLEAPCQYFIICEAPSNIQILAIDDYICKTVRKNTGEKPSAVEGEGNASWVVIDYGNVMVHIFEPEMRQYYKLERLWSDAKLTDIPDED